MNSLLYVRRCHGCGETIESSEDILKCGTCQRSLLPFNYFDKRKVDSKDAAPNFVQLTLGNGPIFGLMVYW